METKTRRSKEDTRGRGRALLRNTKHDIVLQQSLFSLVTEENLAPGLLMVSISCRREGVLGFERSSVSLIPHLFIQSYL